MKRVRRRWSSLPSGERNAYIVSVGAVLAALITSLALLLQPTETNIILPSPAPATEVVPVKAEGPAEADCTVTVTAPDGTVVLRAQFTRTFEGSFRRAGRQAGSYTITVTCREQGAVHQEIKELELPGLD